MSAFTNFTPLPQLRKVVRWLALPRVTRLVGHISESGNSNKWNISEAKVRKHIETKARDNYQPLIQSAAQSLPQTWSQLAVGKPVGLRATARCPIFPKPFICSWVELLYTLFVWYDPMSRIISSYTASSVHPQAWRLEGFQIGCLVLWSRDTVGGRWSKSILPRLEKKRFFWELNVSAERGATLWNSLTQSNSKISDSRLMGSLP